MAHIFAKMYQFVQNQDQDDPHSTPHISTDTVQQWKRVFRDNQATLLER